MSSSEGFHGVCGLPDSGGGDQVARKEVEKSQGIQAGCHQTERDSRLRRARREGITPWSLVCDLTSPALGYLTLEISAPQKIEAMKILGC